MFVKYGTHSHDAGEANVHIQKATEFNQAGEALGVKEKWDIRGMLVGSSASDLSTKSAALVTAYALHGQDLSLMLDSSTKSSNYVVPSETLGGIRVISLNFDDNDPASYTTFRRYTISLDFMRPAYGQGATGAAATADNLVAFNETVSYRGGGRLIGHLEPQTGRPIKQTWKKHTTSRCVQAGKAIGFRGYPAFPAPLFPSAINEALTEKVYENPTRENSGVTGFSHYPITWTYNFESSSQLSGAVPNTWL